MNLAPWLRLRKQAKRLASLSSEAFARGVKLVLVSLLAGYRWVVSPALSVWGIGAGSGAPKCRFEPSCSTYAHEAVRTLPLHRAIACVVRRVCRCHPWGGLGSDPVPNFETSKWRTPK